MSEVSKNIKNGQTIGDAFKNVDLATTVFNVDKGKLVDKHLEKKAQGTPLLEAGKQNLQLNQAQSRLELPTGEGKTPYVPPAQTEQASFQMIDSEALKPVKNLKTKLETTLKKKQAIIKQTPTPQTIEEVKKIELAIQNLDNKIKDAERKSMVASGPVKQDSMPIPSVAPVKSPEIRQTNDLEAVRPVKQEVKSKEVKPKTVTNEKEFDNAKKDLNTLLEKFKEEDIKLFGSSVNGVRRGSGKENADLDVWITDKNFVEAINKQGKEKGRVEMGNFIFKTPKQYSALIRKLGDVNIFVDDGQGGAHFYNKGVWGWQPEMEMPKTFSIRDKGIKVRDTFIGRLIEKENPKTLYHGSDLGKLKIDKNGHINLGVKADDVKQFGRPIELDVSKMKIKHFDTKEELFNESLRKDKYRDNYDVLMSGNQAIVITPQKFATKVDMPVRDIRKMTVGGEMKKAETPKEKRPVGAPNRGAISDDEAKAAQSRILQKLREGKTYKDYLREYEAKQAKKQTETQEEIRARLAIEKKLYKESQEASEAIMVEGTDKQTPSMKKRVFEQELHQYKKEGKGEKFFRDLYQKEFDKGTKDSEERADSIFDFMQTELPGKTTIGQIFEMITLKPLEDALNKGIEHGLKFIYKNIAGPQMLESLQRTLKKSEFVNKIGRKIIFRYNQPQWYKDLSEATERKMINVNNISTELKEYLGKDLTNEEKIELQQAIVTGGYHVNPKIGDRAMVARHVLDDYGEQFYRVGAMSRETFEKNKGEYLMRAYYHPEVQKPLKEWYKNSDGQRASLNRAKKRGIEKRFHEDKAQKLIAEGWEDRGPVKSQPGYRRVWRDFTKEERKAMNEVLDLPEYLVSKTIRDVGYDVALLNKFAEVAKHADAVSDSPIKNWVKMPDAKNYGKLAGKYVDPEIAEDIRGIMKARETASKITQAVSTWKKWKVTWNIATHFRNMYWNIILADIAGLSPARVDIYGSALYDVFKGSKSADFVEARNLNTFGGTFTGNELKPIFEGARLKHLGNLEPNKDGLYEVDWKDKLGADITDKFNSLKRAYGKVDNKLGDIYRGEEVWNKLALYKYFKYEKGLSPEEASKQARFWGQDYGSIPHGVREFGRKWWGMPFVSFQYVMVPIIGKALISRTASIAKWILIGFLMEEQARKALKLSRKALRTIKENLFPDWMQNGLYITYPELDENGQYQFLDMSYVVPYVQDVKTLDPTTYYFQNPVAQYGMALHTNIDPFLGTEIWNKQTDPGALGAIKSYNKYLYRQIVPPLAPGGYNYIKIKNAIYDAKYPPLEEGRRVMSINAAIADAIFGFKLRPIDISKEQRYRLKDIEDTYNENMRELEMVLDGRGQYSRYGLKEQQDRTRHLLKRIEDTLQEYSHISGINPEIFAPTDEEPFKLLPRNNQ